MYIVYIYIYIYPSSILVGERNVTTAVKGV